MKGLAILFLNRDCRRRCPQCSAWKHSGPGLNTAQWESAIKIVEGLSDFTLVLGNDPWLAGLNLTHLFNRPTVVYTTAFRDKGWGPMSPETAAILKSLGNFSVGYDYPGSLLSNNETDPNKKKARDAWLCAKEIRKHPDPQVHTTEIYFSCTVHKDNADLVKLVYSDAEEIGAYVSYNFLNYATDDQFDFFPGKDVLGSWRVSPEQYDHIRDWVLTRLWKGRFYIWEPFGIHTFSEMTRMTWHCKGNPYGGPTVDFDGTLRVCGYRKGKRCSELKIWDLSSRSGVEKWREAVHKDAMDCPGCSWSCPMVYHLHGDTGQG